jgi:nucleotide-binding universal stress UspA family protein
VSVVSLDDGYGAPDAGVVRVFAPAGPGRRAVVSWARRHAERTGAGVEVLVDTDPDPGTALDLVRAVHVPLALLGDLLGWASSLLPGSLALADRLGRAAAGARLLVVPQTVPGVDVLVDTAYEPVAVIPDEPPHRDGPVVLALAPRTSDETIDAAFDAAAQRGAALLALRVLPPGSWTLPAPEDAVRAVERERGAWSDHLSAWSIANPRVPLEVRVVDGDPADALAEVSRRARLLVLGRSGRGRLVGAVRPSPVARLTGRSHCPVLVVPPAGPPRRSWWPRS